jgi:NmrA-like family
MARIDPKDGTRTFALPLDQGHLPFLTLQDMGIYALKVFEDRERWSGKTFNIVSHFTTGPELAKTLSKVAGVKAVYKNVSIEEWTRTLSFADAPVASTDPKGITVGQNFAMWWPGFQDSILLQTRDMKLLRKVNPNIETLEGWMRRVGYDGTGKGVLKGWIDAGIGPKA